MAITVILWKGNRGLYGKLLFVNEYGTKMKPVALVRLVSTNLGHLRPQSAHRYFPEDVNYACLIRAIFFISY
jgi:hypothetical protein